MFLLYRGRNKSRYLEMINILREKNIKKAVELCFGDLQIARCCKNNNIEWYGIDINPVFIKYCNNKSICMGSIARLYETIGGRVFILGKPNSFIYKKATSGLKNFQKSKTIAIGDSLDHDIYGASKFGIKSILITSGIHKKVFNSSNLDLYTKIYNLSEFEVIPDFVCEKLTF